MVWILELQNHPTELETDRVVLTWTTQTTHNYRKASLLKLLSLTSLCNVATIVLKTKYTSNSKYLEQSAFYILTCPVWTKIVKIFAGYIKAKKNIFCCAKQAVQIFLIVMKNWFRSHLNFKDILARMKVVFILISFLFFILNSFLLLNFLLL